MLEKPSCHHSQWDWMDGAAHGGQGRKLEASTIEIVLELITHALRTRL